MNYQKNPEILKNLQQNFLDWMMDILNSNFEVFKAGGKQSREQVDSQLLRKL